MKAALLLLLLAMPADVRDELTGQWVGTSICTEPRGRCNDETASYRFSKHEDPNKVTASMNKIVDGNEVVMGLTDFTVDADARTLLAEYDTPRYGRMRWTFSWKGKEMTGTLTELSDGRVIRNIAVQRQ